MQFADGCDNGPAMAPQWLTAYGYQNWANFQWWSGVLGSMQGSCGKKATSDPFQGTTINAPVRVIVTSGLLLRLCVGERSAVLLCWWDFC